MKLKFERSIGYIQSWFEDNDLTILRNSIYLLVLFIAMFSAIPGFYRLILQGRDYGNVIPFFMVTWLVFSIIFSLFYWGFNRPNRLDYVEMLIMALFITLIAGLGLLVYKWSYVIFLIGCILVKLSINLYSHVR